ncbi:NADH dehydrogenase [ubiquinone] 1 alpha subcomplex subunit 2-like [Strongylocentrotus purpuratus]|uniref:NADH dehydrogenase [ubiquinone] 1 alpha subcomplex subunit 2 n=1 Tax=Strongylocentrotus purpuratus TaxID=7668 RepID=A0A7M7NIA6_STRPU|nr:NADH dehydrogenase [ubiquinone] 1 alpha subcomplex subunit 2-like [Strongylocentrotus purpuratus]
MASVARRFPQHLKELRIHLCQRSPASEGARDWVKTQYVDIKKANPRFPILIRECSGVQPKVYARYEFGQEASADMTGFTTKQVSETIQSLVAQQPK